MTCVDVELPVVVWLLAMARLGRRCVSDEVSQRGEIEIDAYLKCSSRLARDFRLFNMADTWRIHVLEVDILRARVSQSRRPHAGW